MTKRKMTKRNKYLLPVLGALALACAPLAASAQPGLIETKKCAECHGQGGASTKSTVPILAGASEFFLENQFFQYQDSLRPCYAEAFEKMDDAPAADHCDLVKDMTEDDFMELAAYYAEQPKVAADQPFDPDLAAIGAQVHEEACDRCHSDGGSLALDDAGILAGQWKEYLLSSMKIFLTDGRWQEERMQEEMAPLSEDQLRALAEYYASEGQRFQ